MSANQTNMKKVELLAYLGKGELFNKLRHEKQKMKISCLEKCLNFDEPNLDAREQTCLKACREKIDYFLRFSDDLYQMKFFQ